MAQTATYESSWTAPARSADGRRRRSNRTTPLRICDSWTTTIPPWRRKPHSRASRLDNEMHVRTPDGAWLKGFAAWQALLRVMPKLAWLGRIASMPPVRWIGPSAYAFIARHRYSLPGAPARCETRYVRDSRAAVQVIPGPALRDNISRSVKLPNACRDYSNRTMTAPHCPCRGNNSHAGPARAIRNHRARNSRRRRGSARRAAVRAGAAGRRPGTRNRRRPAARATASDWPPEPRRSNWACTRAA